MGPSVKSSVCAWAAITAMAGSAGAASAAVANAKPNAVGAAPSLMKYADFGLQPTEPEEPVAPPPPKTWVDGWKGGVELGLAGSEGNTSRIAFRTGVTGQRLVEKYDTRFLLNYIYAAEDGDKTDHRFRGELRNDWLFKDSKWRFFAQLAVDVDEFKDWEWRLQGFVGAGYQFIKNEKTELIGRAGLGASREFGGGDSDIVPEALLGIDFMRQITARQKFTFTGEVYPSLSDVGEFRALARAGYEILVDPEVGMSLKLGVEDRYDSDPGAGTNENDFDYYALLVWAF